MVLKHNQLIIEQAKFCSIGIWSEFVYNFLLKPNTFAQNRNRDQIQMSNRLHLWTRSETTASIAARWNLCLS